MPMITDEHMEWATVHRLRDMLVNVHDEYKVTHTMRSSPQSSDG